MRFMYKAAHRIVHKACVSNGIVTGWVQAEEQAESKKPQYNGLIINKTGYRQTEHRVTLTLTDQDRLKEGELNTQRNQD